MQESRDTQHPPREKNKKSRKKVLTNGAWCGNINELSARGQRREAKKWLNKAKNAVLHHGRQKSPTLEKIEKRLKKCLTKSGRHDIRNKLFRGGQQAERGSAKDLEN